jgi:hypothetical protein
MAVCRRNIQPHTHTVALPECEACKYLQNGGTQPPHPRINLTSSAVPSDNTHVSLVQHSAHGFSRSTRHTVGHRHVQTVMRNWGHERPRKFVKMAEYWRLRRNSCLCPIRHTESHGLTARCGNTARIDTLLQQTRRKRCRCDLVF